jgi:Ethanolamine utilization protein EutJ (predicted chaperonin)
LYEYQNKRVTKIAFRKRLILKDAVLVVLGLGTTGIAARKKEKREQAPALHM